MDVPQPMLLLVVPAAWAEEYSGRLYLRMASTLCIPLAHYCGLWIARRDLTPRIEAAFYSLAWLELEDVS